MTGRHDDDRSPTAVTVTWILYVLLIVLIILSWLSITPQDLYDLMAAATNGG